MRELAGIVLSVTLPWLAGALAVAALWRGRAGRSLPLCIGYGYVVGALATVVVMRAASTAGLRWSFSVIAAVLVGLGGTAAYAAKPLRLRAAYADSRSRLAALPALARGAFWFFVALCAVNVAALVACVAWGLIEPYDALTQWADKARVWYEYGRIAPFVNSEAWRRLGDVGHFWDMNPYYPPGVPLLQVWTSLAAGRWDESLMNMPWAAAFAALGFAFYAQARRLGAGPAKAMAATYLLLSIPLLQINVAVAGMADVFVAVSYGLAAIGAWQWTRSRQWQDAALAILAAALCAMVKKEGIVWMLTLVPAVLVAIHRRVGLALCAAAAGAGLAFLAFGPGEFAVLGYKVTSSAFAVWGPTLEHMFVMDNWHLAWYAAAAIVAWNAPRLLAEPLAPATATMAAAAAFVLLVYGFSNAAVGVAGENLVNRFLLQTVPALAFYLLVILADRDAPAAIDSRAPIAADPL